MNSRQKGKRIEREAAQAIGATFNVAMRRGVQFAGGPDSPDVVGLPGVHFEVKGVERLNIWAAMEQAIRDAGNQIPVVACKRNRSAWLLVVPLDQANRLVDAILATREQEKA